MTIRDEEIDALREEIDRARKVEHALRQQLFASEEIRKALAAEVARLRHLPPHSRDITTAALVRKNHDHG